MEFECCVENWWISGPCGADVGETEQAHSGSGVSPTSGHVNHEMFGSLGARLIIIKVSPADC